VDRLDGDASTKQRLRVILATLTGAMTVEEACRELEVGEARFHVLRHEALEGALSALSPKRPGRPAAPEPTEAERKLVEQQEEIAYLKLDLYAARIREKLALTMPHVLHLDKQGGPPGPSEKKSRRKKRR
jgi:transposase-like protein